MTCEHIAPRIVYGPSLRQIIFNLPLENREIQNEIVNFNFAAKGTVKTSASGKTETVVNFIEQRINLQFRIIDKNLKDALETMYLEWAVFGNPFFFFPDKTKPEFIAFILNEKARNFTASAVGTKWDVSLSSRTVLEPEPEVPAVGDVTSVNGETGDVILTGDDIEHPPTGNTISDEIEFSGIQLIVDANNASIAVPIIVDFSTIISGFEPEVIGVFAKSSGGGGGGANDTGAGDVDALPAGDLIIFDSGDNPIITIPGGRGGYTDSPDNPNNPGTNPLPVIIDQPLLVTIISTESGPDGGRAARVTGAGSRSYTGQEGESGTGVRFNINLPPDRILKYTVPTGGAGGTESTGEDGGDGRDGNVVNVKRFLLA